MKWSRYFHSNAIAMNSPILCDPIGLFFVVKHLMLSCLLKCMHFHEEKVMHQLFSNHAKLAK